MMTHSCNPSAVEAEAGGAGVQGSQRGNLSQKEVRIATQELPGHEDKTAS